MRFQPKRMMAHPKSPSLRTAVFAVKQSIMYDSPYALAMTGGGVWA